MADRGNSWIQTASGRPFWPMDPRPEEIFIEDIAHSLAMMCRYAGHCIHFYSVAEHCCHLHDAASEAARAHALLHDASEAYIVDVPRPIKPHLVGYREIEARIMSAVWKRFGLSETVPEEVHELDNRILMDERAQNMSPSSQEWSLRVEPIGITLQYWTPPVAKREFLSRFVELSL